MDVYHQLQEETERLLGESYRARYAAWLHATSAQHCRAAEAAFTAQEVHSAKDPDSQYYLRSYFMLLTSVESGERRAMRDWRHPQLNLDLLQVAVMHDDTCAAACAEQANYYGEGYDGNSASGGELVNHPIHLACVFQSHSFVRFTTLSELPWEEEGIIKIGDIWRFSSQSPSGNLLGNNTTLRGTTLQFAAKYSPKCLSELLALALRTVETEAKTGGTSASSVSRLWDVISTMADKGRAEDTCIIILKLLRDELLVERRPHLGQFLLLFHQLVCASEWNRGKNPYVERLPFSTAMLEADISLTAQFLTQGQLFSFIEILERLLAAKCLIQYLHKSFLLFNESAPLSWKQRLLTLLKSEQRERTLHQECVLALIRSVRGDVRRLQRVNMPDSLRQYFPVPFSTQEAEPSNDAP